MHWGNNSTYLHITYNYVVTLDYLSELQDKMNSVNKCAWVRVEGGRVTSHCI